MMGGIVLHEGDVAEMKTGEGKTFVASLALYLNALPTVDDPRRPDHRPGRPPRHRQRLPRPARRRVEPRRLRAAGHDGRLHRDDDAVRGARKLAYEADITYGTNSEFGFDYLRDNMAISLDGTVQRGHPYAIVDEVDSILIDEARTPLIISGEPTTAAKTYTTWRAIVRGLRGIQSKGDKAEDEALAARVRLPLRREAQDRLRDRVGDREGRARAAGSRTSTTRATSSSSTT